MLALHRSKTARRDTRLTMYGHKKREGVRSVEETHTRERTRGVVRATVRGEDFFGFDLRYTGGVVRPGGKGVAGSSPGVV